MPTAVDKYPSNPLSDQVGTTSNRNTISVTCSATPHTLSAAFVEVDPSLSADCDGIVLNPRSITFADTTNGSCLLRIYTGAGGAETTWATVAVGYNNYSSGAGADETHVIFIPGRITSGTRVSIKAQAAVASRVVDNIFTFLASDKTVDYGSPTSIGFDLATSKGVDLTAPGSLNTKGAWTEIIASTAAAYTALFVGIQGAAGTAQAKNHALIDIGIGGAGSETVLIPDIHIQHGPAEKIHRPSPTTYGVDIPSGSRISARFARASTANAVDICLVAA